jgi:hypothetical protein
MPSSRPDTIPTVIHLLRQLRPESILDVGIGFGKWGHLFREYTDIHASENDPKRYHRNHWRVQIDGIEGHADYLTEMHRFLYNTIWTGNALDLIRTVPDYDLIFLGDIIEHFDKPQGRSLLDQSIAKARKAVLVSTPKFATDQADLCGNELERHRSLWTPREFHALSGASVKTLGGDTLLVLILKAGVAPVTFPSPKRSKAHALSRQRLNQSRHALAEWIPNDTPFVLIDEEQLRSQLPHARAIPFLEREGRYWGPPGDDALAISELERLRSAGACYLVVVWTCFWWLDHYAGFAAHIQQHYPCVTQNALFRIFNLTGNL